jgi:hypothetical protein
MLLSSYPRLTEISCYMQSQSRSIRLGKTRSAEPSMSATVYTEAQGADAVQEKFKGFQVLFVCDAHLLHSVPWQSRDTGHDIASFPALQLQQHPLFRDT